MNNHRITTTIAVAAAALAAAAPASFGGPSLSAAVHLEAHANADTTTAKKVMRTSSARARKLMARGTRELGRAAAIVRQADAKAEASGANADNQAVLTAQASLSTAASDQSFTLSSIAQKATGVVAEAAQRAQAKADAIRSQADSALSASADPQPAEVSVSVTAQAGSSDDDQATGGVQLLGILAGGDGQ
jgi:hypothetical protein